MTKARLILAIAAGAMTSAMTASLPAAAQSANATESALEAMIMKVLEKRPDLVNKAMEANQNKANEDRQKMTTQAMVSVMPEIRKASFLPATGAASGTLVVSFFDYNCGYCKKFENETKIPAADVLGKEKGMRVIYVYAPILSEGSQRLAEIAEAAHLQGKFLPVHTFLMARPGGVGSKADADKIIPEILTAVPGLDEKRLRADLTSGIPAKTVDKHKDLVLKAKLQGTPLIYANSQAIGGAIPLEPFLQVMRGPAGPNA